MKLSQIKKNVLNQFEVRSDEWTFSDFERAISAAVGGSYQSAKLVIVAADEQGSWPKTVERYIRTNYAAFGNVPVELIRIASRFDLKS